MLKKNGCATITLMRDTGGFEFDIKDNTKPCNFGKNFLFKKQVIQKGFLT